MQTLYVREKEKNLSSEVWGNIFLHKANYLYPPPSPPPPPNPKCLKRQLAGHLVSTKPKTNNKEKN